MKNLILSFFVLASMCVYAQPDNAPIVVNVRDNPKLQFNGAAVKVKAVIDYFHIDRTKDFQIGLTLEFYVNNSGAYGPLVVSVIAADTVNLTADERAGLIATYGNRQIVYSTAGKYVNAAGDIVTAGAPGAIPELQYWQTFKLNQVAGMGTLSTQGAMDAQYLILKAIINKLNSRKQW